MTAREPRPGTLAGDPMPFKNGRLTLDPRGWHVILPWKGRTLIGEIVGVAYREHPRPGYVLTVRHFCGAPWPVEPGAGAVRVLQRGAL